jgi:hypothetical protein
MLVNEIPDIHLMNGEGRRNFYTRLPAPPAPGRPLIEERSSGIVIVLPITGTGLMEDIRKTKNVLDL